MRFLVDTNIFFLSDYTLHSIGLLLFRRKQHIVFHQFLKDMISNAGLRVIALLTNDMETVIKSAHKFNLDFDDAYQYVVAEKNNLLITGGTDSHFIDKEEFGLGKDNEFYLEDKYLKELIERISKANFRKEKIAGELVVDKGLTVIKVSKTAVELIGEAI